MDESVFLPVVQAVKGYLERLILGEAEDATPLEEGIICLQSIYRSLSRDEEFQQDVSFNLEKLGSENILNETGESQNGSRAEHEFTAGDKMPGLDKKLTDEDIQILREFVSESLENLASIEVKLIYLEESPDDLETINDIFRPFHTIKGISSYLNLEKINSLSHSAESLLDKARDGEIKIDEDFEHVWHEKYAQINKRGTGTIETCWQRKDGKQIDVLLSSTPIDIDNLSIGLTFTALDITSSRQEEEVLRESERQVRLLLDSTAEGIYGLDMNGSCTFANPACLQFLGYKSTEDLIGQNIHALIHHTRPDGKPYPTEEYRKCEAIKTRKGVHVDDEILWRADGTSFPAEYRSYPIFREDKVIGSVVTF